MFLRAVSRMEGSNTTDLMLARHENKVTGSQALDQMLSCTLDLQAPAGLGEHEDH